MSKNLVTQAVYGTHSNVLKKYHIHFQVQKYDLQSLDMFIMYALARI